MSISLNKKIALTFDYELFLGKDSGTAAKTLLGPTDMVLKILETGGARGIFFVDALYLLALKEQNHPDYKPVVGQLENIIKAGSDIQLHIHPQWIDGIRLDEKRWTFSKFDTFRLHAVPKKQLETLFEHSLEELYRVIHRIKPAYKITSFRAGGWSVQPFDYVKDIFTKNDIRIDFSVNPGEYKNNLPEHYFDYRSVNHLLDHWFFTGDPVTPEEQGEFLEIPISKVSIFKGPAFVDWKKVCREEQFSDGTPLVSPSAGKNGKQKSFFDKVKALFQRKLVSLSLEDHTLSYFKGIMKKMNRRPGRLLTAIGHPKNMSKSGVENIEFLVQNYETVGIDDIKRMFLPGNLSENEKG